MTNYKLVMQGMETQFFTLKATKRYNKHIHRVLFKLQDSKIWYFICLVKKIVNYLENLPLFRTSQEFLDEK